jgi:hypothetical protein
MTDTVTQYNGKYGFEPADERCISTCAENSLISPQIYRYLGMGHYEILADVKGHPNKYFLVRVGGSNGYDVDYNQNQLLKLTEADAMSEHTLRDTLKHSRWIEIVGTVQFEGGEEHACMEHTGME